MKLTQIQKLSVTGDVLTQRQVAQLLQLSEPTVCKLTKTGDLPHWRIGRSVRYSRSVILKKLSEK